MWLVDSTPVECGGSPKPPSAATSPDEQATATAHRTPGSSWGLRLHLVATPSGLPVTFALTNPKSTNATWPPTSSPSTPGCTTPAPRPSSPTRATGEQPRTPTRPRRHHPHPPGPQRRTTPTAATPPQTLPPDHRVDQPDPQPNSTSNATAAVPPTASGPESSNDSSPSPPPSGTTNHPPTRTRPLPPRLRPLTPWNYPSSPRLVRRGRSATLASVARPFARVPGAPVSPRPDPARAQRLLDGFFIDPFLVVLAVAVAASGLGASCSGRSPAWPAEASRTMAPSSKVSECRNV